MAHVRSARTLVRSTKRPTFWVGGSLGVTIATGTVVTQTIVAESELESVPNPTIVRVRGEVIIRVSAIGASGAAGLISLGLILQSARSIAAGVTGMPVPFTDLGSKWLYHRMIPIQTETQTNEDSNQHNVRFEVDNKSMRKTTLNEGLVMVLQNTALNSTFTAEVFGGFRVLVKR